MDRLVYEIQHWASLNKSFRDETRVFTHKGRIPSDCIRVTSGIIKYEETELEFAVTSKSMLEIIKEQRQWFNPDRYIELAKEYGAWPVKQGQSCYGYDI